MGAYITTLELLGVTTVNLSLKEIYSFAYSTLLSNACDEANVAGHGSYAPLAQALGLPVLGEDPFYVETDPRQRGNDRPARG